MTALDQGAAIVALDEWCKLRAAKVSRQAEQHIASGLPLNAPNYRAMLGEHRAYMAMRSFIHGSRLIDAPEKEGQCPT